MGVKDGTSLGYGMLHDLRNGIIMRNATCRMHDYAECNKRAPLIRIYFFELHIPPSTPTGFQSSVVKQRTKKSPWPITKDIGNPVNQSNTCISPEARENLQSSTAVREKAPCPIIK